jgi:hypothetical protein
MTTAPEPLPPIGKKSNGPRAAPWARAASWIVGLTAVALLGTSVGGWLYDRKQNETMAAAYLRLIVTGPAALESGTPAEYNVATTTVTGDPLASSIEWSLRSPDGKRLIERNETKETSYDNGRWRITIPADMALPSPTELDVTAIHAGQREEVKTVLAVQPTRYDTQLTLDRPCCQPGETVYYRSLTLSRFGLAADRALPIHFEILDPSGAVLAGSPLEGMTDHGVGNGAFVIPKQSPDGKYTLVARSMDRAFAEQKRSFFIRRGPRPREEPAKDVPGKFEVAFYPEGGELVADLENRVYFAARDPLGKPAGLKGIVLDNLDQEVVAVEASQEGMGSFNLTPSQGLSYRLRVTSPKGIGQPCKLPEVAAERKIVLSAGSGVFTADAPLEFNIRAAQEGIPLAVVAWCRGVPVGEQTLTTTLQGHDHGANPVVIPVDEQTGGVIRLTVYDYSSSPPQLVAQRLVYRQMSRWLTVRAADRPARDAARGKADLALTVANEKGDPVPAILSVTALDRTLPRQFEGPSAGATTRFLLGDKLSERADLDRFDFRPSDDTDATAAMDLLLGTQGARHAAGADAPPLMFDNLTRLRAEYEKTLTDYQETRTRALALVVLCFFGGLGLLLLVTMLAILRVVSGLRLWLPTVAAATCCVLIGLNLMEPGRHKVDRRIAPFAPFAAKPFAEAGGPSAPAKAAVPKTLKTFTARPFTYRRVAGSPAASPDQKSAKVEMLYWNPLVIAGPDGRVQISFDLPEADAAFDVLADAHSDGRVGDGRVEVKAAGRKR